MEKVNKKLKCFLLLFFCFMTVGICQDGKINTHITIVVNYLESKGDENLDIELRVTNLDSISDFKLQADYLRCDYVDDQFYNSDFYWEIWYSKDEISYVKIHDSLIAKNRSVVHELDPEITDGSVITPLSLHVEKFNLYDYYAIYKKGYYKVRCVFSPVFFSSKSNFIFFKI